MYPQVVLNIYYCFAVCKYYHVIHVYIQFLLYSCTLFSFVHVDKCISYLTATQHFHCVNIANLFILLLTDT